MESPYAETRTALANAQRRLLSADSHLSAHNTEQARRDALMASQIMLRADRNLIERCKR